MRLRALLLGLLLVFSAVPARAEDDIRQTFQRGLAEYNLGNYAEAAKLFEDVYRQKPAAALLFNIAQCYRFLGNLPKAETTYRAYLRNAQPKDKNLQRGKELLAEVEKTIAKQNAVANAAPRGAANVPETPPAKAGKAEQKAAGAGASKADAAKPETATAADAASKTDAVSKADAAAGQKVAMATPVDKQAAADKRASPAVATTTPHAAPPTTPAPREATQPAPLPEVHRSHTVAWIAGGAAAVALAGGGLLGMKSASTLASLQSSPHPQAQIDADRASAKSEAGKANALFAAGAVLAVASATFFVIGF